MIPALGPPRLLVVVGPTGTGKSALAVELAQELGGEVVGCDALQVYRDLDVATAKPSAGDRQRVPHHLIDFVDPRTDFTLAAYVRLAEQAVQAIAGRGRVPIVVGGTGLYLRGLLRGIIPAPERDPELRERLRRIADRGGLPRLRRWLARLDPGSVGRIAPGDTQRTLRALELALHEVVWSARLAEAGTWSSGEERYPSLKIGLDADRAWLASRLDARVAGFFEAGLAREVERLLAAGVPASANALKAIGYREVLGALMAGVDPARTMADVQRSTRRFAKRQRTWFRKETGVTWLDARSDRAELSATAARAWRASLARVGG
jgi:tRNA dimethylallyltransferase